jgi:hypothetical protein
MSISFMKDDCAFSHNDPMAALSNTPRIVMVGCGFGGLEAARALHDAPADA